MQNPASSTWGAVTQGFANEPYGYTLAHVTRDEAAGPQELRPRH